MIFLLVAIMEMTLAMSNNKLSEVLKRLLFQHDLKVIDLARKTAVPQPTLQRLVAGNSTRPQEKSLVPIAKYFNISLEQLRGEEAIVGFNRSGETLQAVGVQQVPMLEWKQVYNWLNNSVENSTTLAKTLTDCEASQRSFALCAKDSSMQPIFPAGTILIFDPEQEIKDRCYVLVKLAKYDEPVFRQLLLDAEDKFIKPLSPELEQFRVHMLTEEDFICGVLVESKQQYKN